MRATYSSDMDLAAKILSGDVDVWRQVTSKLSVAMSSWKNNPSIDHEDIINFAIYKAAGTYRPESRFINHAIRVCRNLMGQCYHKMRTRADVWNQEPEIPYSHPLLGSSVLDQMIAREDALILLKSGTDCYVMTQLILAGKTRAEAARIMGIDRFKAHSVVSKMRDMLDTEEE